jgi:3-dehydroquinate dehydratase II
VSAAELDDMLRKHAKEYGYTLSIFYTNSEGAALDRLYQAVEEGVNGLVMNPGGWSHAGHSLRYCLQGINLPYVEVHIRNQYKMKVVSTLADLAVGAIQGFGIDSYFLGLDAMLRVLNRDSK